MKIKFLFKGTFPGGMAMSKRLRLYCRALAAAGAEPEVLALGPGEGSDGKDGDIPASYYRDPVITRLPLLKALNTLVAAIWYYRRARRWSGSCDVLFISGFGWLLSLAILLGAHRAGTRVAMESNENPYSPEGGRLDFVIFRRINRWFMLKLVFPRMDGFIVISEKLEELVKRHGRNPLLVRVPILVGDEVQPQREVNTGDTPFILHTGAMSETKDGLVAVFRAFVIAASALDGRLRFVLTRKQMLSSLSRQLDEILQVGGMSDRVRYLGFVGDEELQDLRARCATAVLNKPSNWQNDYNFSTKLGEYMLAGIPVIASDSGEMSRFLQDGSHALLCRANDSEAMAERILRVVRHPEEAARIGEAGRERAMESFHYLHYSQAMTNFFRELAERNNHK